MDKKKIEELVEYAVKILSPGLLPKGKSVGFPDLVEEDGYYFLTKDLKEKIAKQILGQTGLYVRVIRSWPFIGEEYCNWSEYVPLSEALKELDE